MRRIYLDNCSTSYPKATGVAEAMSFYLTEVGCNIGRGNYSEAYDATMIAYETRNAIAELVNYKDPKNVIFTQNITQSLNTIIKGYLKSGDHVLVSSMEHNAMMRPMAQMEKKGVMFDRIPCDEFGYVELETIPTMIKENTKAIFMLHSSNVCGTIMDFESVGRIAKEHKLTFVADVAQTLGTVPVDMERMNIDILCFTGHKSLRGPQGIGGFVIRDEYVNEVEPLISGGTGSKSDSEEVPNFLPDRFESGTMNLPGIYGLHAALKECKKHNPSELLRREQQLIEKLQNGIEKISGIRIVGEPDPYKRCPILAIDFETYDNAEIGFQLEANYGIMTRCGLHCAPYAHRTLGTFPQGIVRFSCGPTTTEEEIEIAIEAIKELCDVKNTNHAE
ncbi:MAG: aminotransferase class V-fold PLP-dependent enzyme [Eubacteriales bacterium]